MGQVIIRGVPPSILQDSWWLDVPDRMPNASVGNTGHGKRKAAGALVVLVALADVLFLDHAPGISLAVFALAVAGAVWFLTGRRKGQVGPALLLGFSILPVVDYVQALSAAFLIGGATVALCWAVLGHRDGATVRRFWGLLPVSAIRQVIDTLQQAHSVSRADNVALNLFRSWGFPIGGALVLGSLMLSANPVLSDWMDQVWRFDIRLDRIFLWIGVVMIVWPVLAVAVDPGLLASKQGPRRQRSLPNLGLNASSVANALILFNLLLAVQTVMDAVFLWGSATLPEGLSYAEYAHRGAYPLLATALLAGGFALMARPFLGEQRSLTGWMMLWLAQNVLLVVSSLMRLSLYVDAYGLTYLRIYAVIWMELVAVGLCLTAWQILKGKSNRWLMTRSLGLGLGVLYACCFVNFAAMIARENLKHPDRLDRYYICELGPMAVAEIAATNHLKSCRSNAPHIDNWREWGFRKDRVIRKLNAINQPEAGHENPRRG